eukprot:3195553-Rhodomonas_salina.1
MPHTHQRQLDGQLDQPSAGVLTGSSSGGATLDPAPKGRVRSRVGGAQTAGGAQRAGVLHAAAAPHLDGSLYRCRRGLRERVLIVMRAGALDSGPGGGGEVRLPDKRRQAAAPSRRRKQL